MPVYQLDFSVLVWYTVYIMIRKQIYLPEELGRRLAVASKQQQKSEARRIASSAQHGDQLVHGFPRD